VGAPVWHQGVTQHVGLAHDADQAALDVHHRHRGDLVVVEQLDGLLDPGVSAHRHDPRRHHVTYQHGLSPPRDPGSRLSTSTRRADRR
jgi:hypothetical protein